MVAVYIICEGQTEVQFVEKVLAPQFGESHIFLYAVLLGQSGHKGGNVNLSRLIFDISKLIKQRPDAFCSTFIDFYGLPPDFPGKQEATQLHSIEAKAQKIETRLREHISAQIGIEHSRFIPYVQMYEFEALLFSDPQILAQNTVPALLTEFTKIRENFSSPEEINDSPDTAPSKRIEKLFPKYAKPTGGRIIAEAIGLDKMRQECALFRAWLTRLEQLNQ